MKKLAAWIVRRKALILILFGVLTVFSLIATPLVPINYNLAEYVPESAPSTIAMQVMEQEFRDAIPNARVYIPNLSLQEALQAKEKLEKIPDVTQVLWLDDFYDVRTPLEMADPDLVAGYFADGNALYQVVTDIDNTVETKLALQEVAGEEGAVEGQLIDLANAQLAVSSEITMVMLFMVPLGVGILLLATESWLSPLLLLLSMGIAILLNLGTNIFKSEVSFLTQAVTAVLQLAVSMDYGIFLLHRYEEYRAADRAPVDAMREAIVKSASPILASSMTTVFGFLALIFMQFRIGPDLGIVLAKGVLFSLICVIFLLPVLILVFEKWVEKTRHRNFLPDFNPVAKAGAKLRLPILILVGLMIIPAFRAQQRNEFIYGNADYDRTSREYHDRNLIENKFGKQLSVALLVPKGEWGKEKMLHDELEAYPEVGSIISYESQVSRLIPSEMLDPKLIEAMLSENYSRIILTVRSEKEGPRAFDLVERLRKTADKYYEENYLVGESVVTYDMRDVVQKDNIIVNGLAILTVGLVVMISFRSLMIPLLLLLTIEASIWFNLTVPYLNASPISYIGYLIISTIQLGATVDYGILFTQHYVDNRRSLLKKDAARETVRETIGTLLPPALILTVAGTILRQLSTLAIVSELGEVLARGASFSFLMVVFFLPGLLVLCDRLIEKTTRGFEGRKMQDENR
ncbi:MAG: MMPL family transporter [Tissierellia bacterium]|jgi:predicted RND superfamily exporter protein|nr:MMPL family transporter [Bacillota bacterium]NLK59149.1 MMPL family transporter [Tissierellia bacterium]